MKHAHYKIIVVIRIPQNLKKNTDWGVKNAGVDDKLRAVGEV